MRLWNDKTIFPELIAGTTARNSEFIRAPLEILSVKHEIQVSGYLAHFLKNNFIPDFDPFSEGVKPIVDVPEFV